MSRVRPLLKEDIPQVAALHQRVFRAARGSPEELRSYLARIFCEHPWYEEAVPSLAYEERDGRIVGCVGVMPRPMSMNGRRIRAAVTHNFMVDPEHRSSLAAVQLLKACSSGLQDLSLAESTSSARRLWEGFGGTTSLLHSIRWIRPLQPTRCFLAVLGKRGYPTAAASVLRPLCGIVDAVAVRMPHTPFRQDEPSVPGEDMGADTLLWCVSEFSRGRSLRPEYDARSIKWLLETLSAQGARQTLRKVLVRTARGEIAGWYLYYVKPEGIGEVVQIGARPDSIDDVLGHLFYDAWRYGLFALSGQLEPGALEAFSAKGCLFDRGFWLLVHSKHAEVLQAIYRGDAFLTRLEGEGWMRLAF